MAAAAPSVPPAAAHRHARAAILAPATAAQLSVCATFPLLPALRRRRLSSRALGRVRQ